MYTRRARRPRISGTNSAISLGENDTPPALLTSRIINKPILSRLFEKCALYCCEDRCVTGTGCGKFVVTSSRNCERSYTGNRCEGEIGKDAHKGSYAIVCQSNRLSLLNIAGAGVRTNLSLWEVTPACAFTTLFVLSSSERCFSVGSRSRLTSGSFSYLRIFSDEGSEESIMSRSAHISAYVVRVRTCDEWACRIMKRS